MSAIDAFNGPANWRKAGLLSAVFAVVTLALFGDSVVDISRPDPPDGEALAAPILLIVFPIWISTAFAGGFFAGWRGALALPVFGTATLAAIDVVSVGKEIWTADTHGFAIDPELLHGGALDSFAPEILLAVIGFSVAGAALRRFNDRVLLGKGNRTG